MVDHINVKGQGGTFAAYIARPKILPASAVVVLQELFGVNADIRKHCDELAEQGYLAVAPDAGVKDIKGSLLAPYGDRDVLSIASDLDAKVEDVLRQGAA